ncbi:MAG TPA: P-loop NTPase fold protein [Acidobacteriaceae bacterium]|nr:P-loop NTPase fold protein [Acidobacteriaceae bacterium]
MPIQDGSLDEKEFAAAESSIVRDRPTADDNLGFTPYVEAITAFLTSTATEPPLTIAIEGEWGSGKSSFMLQLEKAIAGPSKESIFLKELPEWIGGYSDHGSVWKAIWKTWKHQTTPTIRFNAWRHDKQDALWAAFALSFASSLRKRVGFCRGWWGDVRLFISRLSKLRGWIELCLLLISIVLLLYCFSSVYGARGQIWKQHLLGLANDIKPLVSPFAETKDPTRNRPLLKLWEGVLNRAAKFGPLGLLFALAVTGLVKFHKQLKLPISIDLKKYLSTPDYAGHTAFIESFHEDFARLVKAYGGSKRIFIFIDDLDRTDVPRAAELMQGINLMISDVGRLVFILGMDREKVAAGITQKYKDLLPFLPDYTTGMALRQSETSGSSLSFGYSYLEKFIQLSFTVPVIFDKAALEKFLDRMGRNVSSPNWLIRVNGYWKRRLVDRKNEHLGRRPEPHARSETTAEAQSTIGDTATRKADSDSINAERRIREIRIKVDRDSSGVRSIVSMVGAMFEYNPRRIKQFVSTFRLALALTSDQGILGLDPGRSGVTPPQLGKFVALTMKFPDLRLALFENRELLGDLENAALTWPADAKPDQLYWRWLRKKAVCDVLLYGVRNTRSDSESGSHYTPNPFSLVELDISRLISLLPKVPMPIPVVTSDGAEVGHAVSTQPPNVADSQTPSEAVEPTWNELQARFDALAVEYEQIRETQRPSSKRTINMTAVVERAQKAIAQFSPGVVSAILTDQLKKNSAGNRIIALAIACERVGPSNIRWLLQFLAECHTPFEHYWTIHALQLHEGFFDESIARTTYETLEKLMGVIEKDPGRVSQAKALQAHSLFVIQRRSQ